MQKKLIPTSKVCARYSIVSRTVDRWIASSDIPKPIYIRGLRYWDEQELDQHDDARKAGAQS